MHASSANAAYNRAADADLPAGMPLRHLLPEIGKAVAVEFDGFRHQLPSDPGDHLFPPGVEQAGVIHAGRGRGSAQLAARLDQERTGTEPPGLNGSNRPGGAAPDDQDVGRERGDAFGCRVPAASAEPPAATMPRLARKLRREKWWFNSMCVLVADVTGW